MFFCLFQSFEGGLFIERCVYAAKILGKEFSIYYVINFLRHLLTSASYAILHLWLSGHF